MNAQIDKAVNGVSGWVTERTPGLAPFLRKHLTEYYAPKNFNFWYYFGSLAILVFANQIITGILLTMHYVPTAAGAFASVEYIMRDVEWGWLIRYMHSTGASLFFVVVYLHMFRAMLYGSYQKPRELVWVLGMLIFLVLMAEAFLGYVLPWGQMSFWGAAVIINLFSALPVIGPELVIWIRGDYLVSDATLTRFFALHVVALPLVLLLLIVLHLGALHEVGSNNPDGIDIKKKKDEKGRPLDGIPFHPYYTVKDIFGAGVFLVIAAFIVFFAPTFGNLFLEFDNFNEANPLVTPQQIKPVWYFTPYYAMLRAIPSTLLGVVVMGGAVMIFFLLPWLDRSKVRSYRYRGWFSKMMLALFVVSFVVLGWLGLQPGSELQTLVARICTAFYFLFFFTMPLWTALDNTKPVPERVTSHA
ncbi:cytochrome bc complex cytochrome b subunit [Silanimonas sp.]|uniref:cytochrome b n=1 Tax=Silanimonas sp. TaxID=1929290 RepID=UPI001BBA32D4|nr:cytochrome bc complex cytochrome b subunit [Silanimonas sp.]MBS3897058.1 cytochrome bc complex cytochrome b subunit [Silanimonas sp.]MBS3923992.1 cytochrome bc complex cytochrome b subunit [Xanthomonadaceae bacterium]